MALRVNRTAELRSSCTRAGTATLGEMRCTGAAVLAATLPEEAVSASGGRRGIADHGHGPRVALELTVLARCHGTALGVVELAGWFDRPA